MSGLFRGHGVTFLALSAGVALGATATVLLYKVSWDIARELQRLAVKIEDLRRRVDELKLAVDNKNVRKKRQSGYYSVHASSGEDDDLFEEAISGTDFVSLGTSASSTASDEYLSPSSMNGAVLTAGSVDEVLRKVDKLLEGTDDEKKTAFSILQDHQHLYSGNSNFLWRYAKTVYIMSQIEGASGDEEAKKTLVYKSQDLANRALSMDENDPNIHKWYAITLGSVGDYEGTQAKIQNGFTFKQHIEKAIELKPEDPSSHYLLGRWCYGVYMLSWLERQVAATLFATPPTSTADEALTHFMEAERLGPGKWKENMLFIAKCNIEKRNYYEAVSWLDKAASLPTISQDDRTAQEEVDKLLYSYSGYR